jgi:putative tricarboxylic transport membrane protein
LKGKGNLVSGAFCFIFSVFISIESYRLGLGAFHEPGSGFLYFCTGIFLGILSLSLIVETGRSKNPEEDGGAIFKKLNLRKVLSVLIAIFLYAIFLEKLGFILMTFAVLVFLLGVVERKGWVYTILVSVIITSAAYLVFQTWLRTQLPRGILDFYSF